MAHGFRPVGMEIVGVGTSSDAHHIITPSKGGPQLAMQKAMEDVRPGRHHLGHARHGHFGDASEIANSLEMLHAEVPSPRKGTLATACPSAAPGS
jgi:3-oxoacyl-(acyl-carrier-protein) synthase